MQQAQYHPMFANLQRRRCLVVGGGLIAQRKVTSLLKARAIVTVVSPRVTRRLMVAARDGRIRHVKRRFRPDDLRGVWLVYAATDEPRTNELVFRIANDARVFTNVVDQKALCSFIAPAVLRRGSLAVAVSTGGASPSLAKQLRDELGKQIDAGYPRLLRLLEGFRMRAQEELPGYADRKRYFARLLHGPVPKLVRAGHMVRARQEARRLLNDLGLQR